MNIINELINKHSMQSNEVIVIGGPGGSGKTQLLIDAINNIQLKDDKKVTYFSLDATSTMLKERGLDSNVIVYDDFRELEDIEKKCIDDVDDKTLFVVLDYLTLFATYYNMDSIIGRFKLLSKVIKKPIIIITCISSKSVGRKLTLSDFGFYDVIESADRIISVYKIEDKVEIDLLR